MKVSLISFATTIVIIVAAPSSCAAFLNILNQANPSLTKYADAQENALLKIHLDIGQEAVVKKGNTIINGNRLGIDGLMVKLQGLAPSDYKCPNLPGANGPNPQQSSGAYKLKNIKEGKFVDDLGSQHTDLQDGAWEIIWRKNAKAGVFICGFDVADEIKRNDASIPKGRLYITFPVWTDESLKYLKERKEKAQEVADEALDRLKSETLKMQQEKNPLMKALHFRNTCKAHEDLDYSGYRSYSNMPLESEMVEMNGLSVCSLGTVWTKKNGGIGLFGGADQVLVGSATATIGDLSDLVEMKEEVTRVKPTAYDGLSFENLGLKP